MASSGFLSLMPKNEELSWSLVGKMRPLVMHLAMNSQPVILTRMMSAFRCVVFQGLVNAAWTQMKKDVCFFLGPPPSVCEKHWEQWTHLWCFIQQGLLCGLVVGERPRFYPNSTWALLEQSVYRSTLGASGPRKWGQLTSMDITQKYRSDSVSEQDSWTWEANPNPNVLKKTQTALGSKSFWPTDNLKSILNRSLEDKALKCVC